MRSGGGRARSSSLRKDAPSPTGQRAGPPFRRVLIANRGEIALRIVRACRDLGMETVAVYSDADADAAHVRAADAAVRLGPPLAAESYLRGDLIVEAALATGADAIHPGYGFVAESAEFARRVEAAGLTFVGPPSDVIAALADKLASRRAARDAGVPVVPGTLEPAQVGRPDQVETMIAEAEEVGFPLLVKASAGGGGRGMRRVSAAAELPAALASGSAEAMAGFGDGAVYLEREMRPARHIEVQLLGDAGGHVVALGERDCSIQRRHQKLVEESPAPDLGDAERAEVLQMAVRLGAAAGLRNAVTVEFLFDADRRFWFLEVNTRLQVEHGVTELVAGVDLVAEQFRLAAGWAHSPAVLEAAERSVRPARHAIEVRISAEDPARAFAAAPGRIGRWSIPAGPAIRVDTAAEAGERVPPEYDPLLAKLLVVSSDRGSAIDRLARALDELEVTGIQTTLPFHRFVARSEAFRSARLSTEWVAEHWEPAVAADRAAALEVATATAAAAAWQGWQGTPLDPGRGDGHDGVIGGALPGATQPDSPAPAFDRGDGWRQAARNEAVDRWPG
jgi:acetyl-CoA carboxylase, biotin carboxylase subunit